MRADLPTGTVTFLFTDVEGSTRLLEELGTDGYAGVLAEHHRVCREAWVAHGGVEVDTAGDAFFVVFGRASDALAAARAAQDALAGVGVAVRMGVHTGEVALTETGYVGLEVHRAARIAAAGHGGQVLVSAPAAVGAVPLRDLGEHRFKDLAAPERVFQLGEGEFPPIRSLYRSNLPVPASSFLGRDRELREVTELLSREGVRLVTLTGPGGTGKSRLGLQAAAEVSDSFPDGVWWVSLAPLRDPELALSAIAQVLEVNEEPGRGLAESLVERLGGKRALILLDNAEQLLPELAVELSPLVRDSGTASFLVTSRERLQVTGEQVYAVPELAAEEGVELFRSRADSAGVRLNRSDAMVELCARLDQLPLALELAAARTVVFTPAQLLERLGQRLDLLKGGRDVDPRQQTLRATIAWSYDLLDADEQRLFRKLSVFAGGCTYEAAEEVTGAHPDTLQSLLDKSLLRRRETAWGVRYWMLETIREYGVELLAGDGEPGRRHAAFFEVLAVAAGVGLRRPESPDWVARLEAEQDNLRAAMDWLIQNEPDDRLLRMVEGLHVFWMCVGQLQEGQAWTERVLERTDRASSSLRATVLALPGEFIRFRGDYRGGIESKQAALAMARELGATKTIQRTLSEIGDAEVALGEFEAARAHHEEAVALARVLGDPKGIAHALSFVGELYYQEGDYAAAQHSIEEVLELLAEDTTNRATLVVSLASCCRLQGDEDRARRLLLQVASESNDRWPLTCALEELTILAANQHQPRRAAVLLAASAATRETTGFVSYQEAELAEIAVAVRAELGEPAFAEASMEGNAMTLDQAVEYALAT